MKEITVTIPMSIEDYFAFEESADVRHEYIKGQLIPIPGTTLAHNDLYRSQLVPSPRSVECTPKQVG